jgi:hypothetical protein
MITALYDAVACFIRNRFRRASNLLEWTEREFVGLVDDFGISILPGFIADPKYAELICGMHWWIEDVSAADMVLLTSDRPLWASTGLKMPNCLVALSLTPTRIFFASNRQDLRTALHSQGPDRLVSRCNETIATQAVRFVYGTAPLSHNPHT